MSTELSGIIFIIKIDYIIRPEIDRQRRWRAEDILGSAVRREVLLNAVGLLTKQDKINGASHRLRLAGHAI